MAQSLVRIAGGLGGSLSEAYLASLIKGDAYVYLYSF
jgi:hypothetical protein